MGHTLQAGESVEYKCGHTLTAGTFGIQDVSHIPTRLCGDCRQRLERAAPALLEALEELRQTHPQILCGCDTCELACAAIAQAKGA